MNHKLLITSTDLMMVQFLLPHVIHLSKNGYDIDVACSNVGGRMPEIHEKLNENVKAIYEVHLTRSPLTRTNLKGYREMRRLLINSHYDIIWTNEPVMGVVTRLAARKVRCQGVKILYMAHGFHFFKGASLVNWMLFYPIERMIARFTDVIVTINQEDYHRALKFPVSRVEYIHGIGVNNSRLDMGGNNVRDELNLTLDDIVVVSVGELNKNKNQQVIIKALAKIKNPLLHYILCGKGSKEQDLKKLAQNVGLTNHIHFLGYRKDIASIYQHSDIYVMPSRREGLGLSTLEAMYIGLPVVTSQIQGLKDIVSDSENGFLYSPKDSNGFADGIATLANNEQLRRQMGEKNKKKVIPFLIDNVKEEVLQLINTL